jgi:hypothetical protein
VVVPVQHIGVAETAGGDGCPGLGNQFRGSGERSGRPGLEGLQERRRTEFQLPVRDHPGGKLGLRAAATFEATDPPAGQPAPPQLFFVRDAGEFQHRADAGHLDEYTTEIEQHQFNRLSHTSNLLGSADQALVCFSRAVS